MIYNIILAFALLSFSGCTIQPENMIALNKTQKVNDSILNSNISIGEVLISEEIIDSYPFGVDDAYKVHSKHLKNALHSSLSSHNFLNPNGNYKIFTEFISFVPSGYNSTTKISILIKYIIADKNNNKIIYDELISSSHSISGDADAFLRSKEFAIRKNIEILLNDLYKINHI